MRITYLSHSIIPSRAANSIHVMRMCQAFVRNGHDVTLLARQARQDFAADDYAYYGVRPGFDIIKYPLPGIKFVGSLLQAFWTRWIVHNLPRPDVLYGRRVYSLAALASMNIPMILEVHDLPSNQQMQTILGWLLRHPHFFRLVTISGALRNAYKQLYPQLPDERIIVAHDGADEPSVESSVSEFIWPGRRGVFQAGYTGHLYPGRGVEIIVALAAQVSDIDFHVIGGTEADLRRWRAESQQNNLFFHGHVAPAAVSRYSHRFDLALAPYQRQVAGAGGKGNTARWMSPLKIFEYMALGKAIICSDLPVLREVLMDEVNALLVSPEDVAGWAAALNRLRTEPGLRQKLGATARQDFKTRYSWRARAQRVVAGLPEKTVKCT